MLPTEAMSQPRRALDVEDYIDILRRHKGWIFGPFLVVLVSCVVGVYLWPDTYDSVAVVSIRPSQISDALVPAPRNQDIVDRINALSQQVLSRTELSNLIRTLNLYPRERNLPTEDILDMMRSAIVINPKSSFVVGNKSVPAFEVRYRYYNRHDAQRVVTQLVSKFIDENIKVRGSSTYTQQEFLQSQVDQAKKKLDEIDDKITAFQLANPGRIPNQMGTSLAQMQSVQSNISALTTAISRANAEKLQMETSIRIAREQIAALERDAKVTVTQAARGKSPKLQQAENALENLQTQMIALRKRLRDDHPDMRSQRGMIETAQQLVDRLREEEAAASQAAGQETTVVSNPAVDREIRTYRANIQSLESQIQAKEIEIQGYERQNKAANDQLAILNVRVNTMPVGDQEFNQLLRDQNLAKAEYEKYNQALATARVMVEMEGRKQGESLELLDQATLAQDPTSPDRPMVIGIGAGLGLLLGVVIAGVREMKDTSLKNLKDVRAYTQMAILGSVPLLENDFVVRRRRRIAWLGWTVACLGSAVVMAGSVVYYYVTKT